MDVEQVSSSSWLTHSHGRLDLSQWSLGNDQHWGVLVSHSTLSDALIEYWQQHSALTQSVVSLKQQQQLLEQEIAKDDTDFLDRIDYGSSVEAIVKETGCDDALFDDVVALTDLAPLLQRPFRQLSTGETRRLMLAKALAERPQRLILDEPYTGMDVAHRAQFATRLEQIRQRCQLMILSSRPEELPEWLDKVACVDIRWQTPALFERPWSTNPVYKQLIALSEQDPSDLIALAAPEQNGDLPNPSVVFNQVSVEYFDKVIFKHFDWQLRPGEHWQIRGPNGCGKSTLLSLITGDHPQCYCNDIEVLGFKRGQGESIWQVKQRIGIVSSSLHLQYRVNCSALAVVLSGYFDSIGVYEQTTLKQRQQAKQWLAALGMAGLEKVAFRQLDYGQQRLLLIARALIKHPALLILDEPYQGLDRLSRHLVMAALENIAQSHICQILYVTHYQDDSLSAIQHFIDFVEQPDGGYRLDIHHQSNEG